MRQAVAPLVYIVHPSDNFLYFLLRNQSIASIPERSEGDKSNQEVKLL